MLEFNKLKVKNVLRETPDTVSISFEMPAELEAHYKYKHGQYITVQFELSGIKENRSYSISSSFLMNEDLSITVKKNNPGLISKYINENIKPGDEFLVSLPQGNFVLSEKQLKADKFVFFAGGSGITPIFSIIKQLLNEKSNSEIHLHYSNSVADNIIFDSQLEEFEKKYLNFKVFHYISRIGNSKHKINGKINKELVREAVQKISGGGFSNTVTAVCGPYEKMLMELEALDEIIFPTEMILKEFFYIPKEFKKSDENNSEAEIIINLYGEKHIINGEKENSLLLIAKENGIDAPHSCNIGFCSTCKAKLIRGEVTQSVSDSLTDEEKALGYILTCSSKPLSNNIEIDYDI